MTMKIECCDTWIKKFILKSSLARLAILVVLRRRYD